ncbi:MAG: class I SAM-dependent methyltransferase [Xanthobacteraceae bacterium]
MVTHLRRAMTEDELRRIKEVYHARIAAGVIDRYSLLRSGELLMAQQRERALLALLRRHGIATAVGLRVLEVGCGRAHRLVDWMRWGARSADLAGIDLMEPLAREARLTLPRANFVAGNAASLPFADACFDVVTQFTLFSSILGVELRRASAREMWRVLRPGGFVLWYDFRYPNPRNRDVRPVGRREIANLFPGAAIDIQSVTLAPPLARAIAPWSWLACEIISALPALRTHYAALIAKPARS